MIMILIVNINNIIKIYDNQFENILLETLYSKSIDNITFCKYFPSNIKKESDYLYLFTFREVLVYEIRYLSKKQIIENSYIKANGNIIINYIDNIESMCDVIEFPHINNCVFFVNTEDDSYLYINILKIKKIII